MEKQPLDGVLIYLLLVCPFFLRLRPAGALHGILSSTPPIFLATFEQLKPIELSTLRKVVVFPVYISRFQMRVEDDLLDFLFMQRALHHLNAAVTHLQNIFNPVRQVHHRLARTARPTRPGLR